MKPLAALTPEFVNPLSYTAYRQLMNEYVRRQQTTGDTQSPERIEFTRLNLLRMKRVEKQLSILPEIQDLLHHHQPDWHWVLLTEAWCGDGAQLLPAIAGIAALAPSIKLTILLRDQNPDWMNSCLTNGCRSVPKLICLEAGNMERLFAWGPRPSIIHKMYLAYRAQHPELSTEQAAMQLNSWYAKDRTHALQQDLLTLMEQELINATNDVLLLN